MSEEGQDPFPDVVESPGEDDAALQAIDPVAGSLFARIKAWGLVVSAVGGLVTGVGGIVGGVSGWFRQPQDNRPVKEAYEVLAEQIERLNYGVQQNHEDLVALSNWLDGYVSFADRSYAPKPHKPVPTASPRATGRSPASVPLVPPVPGTGSAHAGAGSGAGPGDTDSDGVADLQDSMPIPEPPPPAEAPAPEDFTW